MADLVPDNLDPDGEDLTKVRRAMARIRQRITGMVGSMETSSILEILDVKKKKTLHVRFTVKELRVIRYAIGRFLESL